MPTPRLESYPEGIEKMQRALNALADHDDNYIDASASLGIKEGTFRHHVRSAQLLGMEPSQKAAKPRIRVPARSTYSPLPDGQWGKAITVAVIGCAHDSPDIPDKSRFTHIGRWLAELRSDVFIDLGDTVDLDSLSRHAMPGSLEDRNKPFFNKDIESVTEAYAAFDKEAPPATEVDRWHIDGNHEYRAVRFEEQNPSAQGVFTLMLDQVWARFNFKTKRFKEWLYINGVGFTHAPINWIGKEYSGKQPDHNIANETTHSVVWSHTHKTAFVNRPKVGVGNAIQVYNTGSAMPMGYIKRYAGLSTTGWTYGVTELTLRDGQIESYRRRSMLELAERYS